VQNIIAKENTMLDAEFNLKMMENQIVGRTNLNDEQANDLWFALNFDAPHVLDLPTLIKYYSITTQDVVVTAYSDAMWKLFGTWQPFSQVNCVRMLAGL
jgi:hypothetical protein